MRIRFKRVRYTGILIFPITQGNENRLEKTGGSKHRGVSLSQLFLQREQKKNCFELSGLRFQKSRVRKIGIPYYTSHTVSPFVIINPPFETLEVILRCDWLNKSLHGLSVRLHNPVIQMSSFYFTKRYHGLLIKRHGTLNNENRDGKANILCKLKLMKSDTCSVFFRFPCIFTQYITQTSCSRKQVSFSLKNFVFDRLIPRLNMYARVCTFLFQSTN